MSHFSVLVRIPGVMGAEDIPSCLEKILIPYCEHEHNGAAKQYMTFVDEEDNHLQDYETGDVDMVRLENGELVYEWDNRFKKDSSIFTTHEIPPHLERVKVPHKERYKTFEEYMSDYCGEQRDPEKKRYGHWRNENAKWDYWRIGGRWRGHLLVKPGTTEAALTEVSYEWKYEKEVPGNDTEVDYCRITDLNWAKADTEACTKVNKFWAEVDQLLMGHKFEVFRGPRDTLLNVGILSCKDANELTGKEFWVEKWDRQTVPGVDRYDVIAVKPDPEELMPLLLSCMHPLRTYAFLDEKGWREKGTMGWWGIDNSTPDTVAKHAADFRTWLTSGDQEDWVVVVDCHI